MRIFLYEWVTGGGMADAPGPLPKSLLTEGLAMAQAAAADFARLPGAQVTLLRDLRVPQLVARGCEIVEIDSRSAHDTEFERLASASDAVMLVAPETDRALLSLAREAETLGAKLISPSARVIGMAGDKSRTAKALEAAGTPVPRGVTLDTGEALPKAFDYPAVIKPLDGAGSQDTYVVSGPTDRPPDYAWPRRLESLAPGTPASVAVLTGPGEPAPLLVFRQRLSTDGRLRYLGGDGPLAVGLTARAQQLAVRAIRALPPCTGYVGVDLVLGAAPDGSEDVVIEVNPRLTTSYIGLRALAKSNLAQAMLEAARSEAPGIEFDQRRIEFDASGAVGFLAD